MTGPWIIAIFIATGLVFATLGFVGARSAPLGVHIPMQQWQNPLISQQKKAYFIRGLVVAVITTAIAYVGKDSPLVVSLVGCVQLIAALWNLRISAAPIRAAKEEQHWFDGVDTRIDAQVSPPDSALLAKLPSMFSATFAFGLSIVVLAVGALPVVARWSDIPDVVPIHWNGNMEADAWGEKSVGTVFTPTWIGVALTFFIALVSYGIASFTVHNRREKGEGAWFLTTAVSRLTAIGVAWLNFAIALGISFLQMVGYTPGYEGLMGISVGLMLLLTLGGSLALVVWIVQGREKFTQLVRDAGLDEGTRPDNDQHLKWGMFYYNPDDPAVLVEKQVGVGVDFNYATWQGKLFAVVIVLILVGSLSPLVFMLFD